MVEGAWDTGENTVTSFFGGTRLFSGAAINNETPPRIASTDRVSGAPPVFFLRRWTAVGGGSTSQELLASSPNIIGSTTGFLDMDDSGNVTFLGLSAGALQLVVFNISLPGIVAPIQVGTTGGPLLRPQMATSTGDVVLRDRTGNAIFVFKGTPAQGSPIATVSTACSSGSFCFKELGSQPGISADGKAVAFYAVEEVEDSGGGLAQRANIFVSVDVGNGNRVITRIAENTLKDAFTDFSLAKDQRIGVVNRSSSAPISSDPVLGALDAQLVTVVFVATLKDPTPGGVQSFPGIYSVDLLFRDDGTQRRLIARAEPRIIAQKGQLNIATGSTFDTFSLTDPSAQDKVLKTPLVVFQAIMGNGQVALFRARKNCDVPDVPYYNQADAPWGNQLYAFHVASDAHPFIKQVGCTLSSSASLLEFYDNFSPVMDPLRLNSILKLNSGYSSNNDVQLDSLPAVARNFGSLGSGLQRDQRNNFNFFPAQACETDAEECDALTTASPDTAPPPIPQEATDRMVDFYVCNGRPVMLRVMRCIPDCGFHYLLATGKTVVPTDKKKSTYKISDPGRRAFKLLSDTGAQGNTTRSYFNRYFGVRAFSGAIPNRPGTRGLQTAPDNMFINVASPVELVIQDPTGRRLGFDPQSRTSYSEIFNASYVHSTIGTLEGGAGSQLESLQIGIGAPEDANGVKVGDGDGVVDGQYTITVLGTGTGPYTIQIASTSTAGKISQRVVRGTATPGSTEILDVIRSSAPGSVLSVKKPSLPNPKPGDIDLNGKIDSDDLNEILHALNTATDGPDDPRDIDHDGKITALDARKLSLLCDKPACAK